MHDWQNLYQKPDIQLRRHVTLFYTMQYAMSLTLILLHCTSAKTFIKISLPGNIQDQSGWGFEQPGIQGRVTAYTRRLGTK